MAEEEKEEEPKKVFNENHNDGSRRYCLNRNRYRRWILSIRRQTADLSTEIEEIIERKMKEAEEAKAEKMPQTQGLRKRKLQK